MATHDAVEVTVPAPDRMESGQMQGQGTIVTGAPAPADPPVEPKPGLPPMPPTPGPQPAPPPVGTPGDGPAIPDLGQVLASAEATAAAELAKVYKGMSGVVAEIIGGTTIADVQASFATAQGAYQRAQAAIMQELGEQVPGARAGAPPQMVPGDPFAMIQMGLRDSQKGRTS